MRDKILKMLGNGMAPSVVALAVGCDPSYVSQLLQDDTFAMEVAAMRCKVLEEATAMDDKYNTLEARLLEKLENILPFLMKPHDILRAIETVNNAKRRGAVPLANNEELTRPTIVNLHLPAITIQQYTVNKDGEVLEVGARQLLNMPAQTLLKSLEPRRAESDAQLANDNQETEKERPRLPRLSPRQIEKSVITAESV